MPRREDASILPNGRPGQAQTGAEGPIDPRGVRADEDRCATLLRVRTGGGPRSPMMEPERSATEARIVHAAGVSARMGVGEPARAGSST